MSSVVDQPQPEQLASGPAIVLAPREGPLAVLRLSVARRMATAWFLNHFALGAWFVTIGSYIKANTDREGAGIFSDGFMGTATMAAPIGAMVAPFLTGVLADRFFATERLMMLLHLVAAAMLWLGSAATTQQGFFLAIIAFFLCYVPTMSLMAAMSMHHLPNPARQYSVVRGCGTIGWIAAGVVVGTLCPAILGGSIERTTLPMKLGAVAELLGAFYCFALPSTPPSRALRNLNPGKLAQPESGKLFRNGSFLCVLAVAFLTIIPSQAYYGYLNAFMNWRGAPHAATRMTLGQVTEVACMLLLPVILMRIGLRAAVLVGAVAWVVRYGLLALAAATGGQAWAIYLAIALHGIAFTFVSISLQLEVESLVDKRRRGTAQGLLSVASQGIGCLAGAWLAATAETVWLPGGLGETTAGGWASFWLGPFALGVIALLAAAALLPTPGGKQAPGDLTPEEPSGPPSSVSQDET
ncbi:MAG: MFS transporter [Pirellulales bacterium]|nr:MFS transporter [Pirellulales bacterium]